MVTPQQRGMGADSHGNMVVRTAHFSRRTIMLAARIPQVGLGMIWMVPDLVYELQTCHVRAAHAAVRFETLPQLTTGSCQHELPDAWPQEPGRYDDSHLSHRCSSSGWQG